LLLNHATKSYTRPLAFIEKMKIEIVQKTNKEYYIEYYSEWLRHKSKFKKWEHIIGFSSMAISFIIYLVDNSLYFISFGLFVFGALMIFEFYSSKNKWLKERFKSKMMNKEVKMIFTDTNVQSFGPFTEMNGNWDFFTKAIETNKGLILIPENGISIYLQKKKFPNQSNIIDVLRKIN